ncbi:MAG TPA: glycine zipper 2TM domain-containing protein [Ramlibacter sp.]|jgi:outer membrane lipoprotein SlyB|uniref:glycine zipper 2TM domain-containing protein n=1 Tax=Ramlibacter sp. TaxID=1917967 RepID=UPI002D34AABE|nr:glycine zipper 2TM domain-containing protein [Ramlibacter sp.]HZY17915.1 glycine zipper 2TM domain-containing protein [Ramlibacter sp.]
MTAATSTPPAAPAATSLRAVPRAVWVVVGTLSLITAGLAGALVSRWAAPEAPAAAPVAALSTVPAAAPATTPAGVAQLQPAPTAPATPIAQPAPQAHAAVPVHKPAPARPAPAVQHPVQAAAPQPVPAVVPTPVETTRAAVCASCGTIESVRAVQEKGEGSGLGAVAGGVVGGLVGHQFGGGNGKTAMTVLGAVGGGLAGHEVEKRARATTAYDVQVRMEDGSVRSFRRAEPMAVGTRVTVNGNALRVMNQGYGAGEPRTLRTSAPTGSGA